MITILYCICFALAGVHPPVHITLCYQLSFAVRVEARLPIFLRVPPAFLPTEMVDEVPPWQWYEPEDVYKPYNYMPRWAGYFEGVSMEVRVAPTLVIQIGHTQNLEMTTVEAMWLSGTVFWTKEYVSTLPLTYGALKRELVQWLQLHRFASIGTEVKLFELGNMEKMPALNKHVFKVSRRRKKPWPRHMQSS